MPPLWEHYKLVIPANFFLINFIHEKVGVPDNMICTIGLGVGAGVSDIPAFTDLADAWATNVVGTIMATDTTFVQMTVADATGVVVSIDRSDVGVDGRSMTPVNCAFIVEKRTGLSGRANRGRLYVPDVAEAEVDAAGNVDGAHRTGIDTDFEAFRVDVEAIDPGEWFLAILHTKKWNGGVEPADPGNAPIPTPITSFYCRSKIGTQRRRLR